MTKSKVAIILLSIMILSCCQKEKGFLPVKGTLKNLTGLDACGWVIYLDKKDKDGCTTLEPRNLNAFKISLVEGKKVKFLYKETGNPSSCMIGKVVDLKSIQDN